MSFRMPSGREVELREPTFGEELDVVSAGADNLKEMLRLKFAVICPGLSWEEIGQLPRTDGRALALEVARIWEGREPEADGPFAPPSSRPATENGSMNRQQRRALKNSHSASG